MSGQDDCFPYDICIDRAKNMLKKYVASPNSQIVNEYAALVQKEYATIEQFVYNNKAPQEDMGKLFDELREKYELNQDVDLNVFVSEKMHLIVDAAKELNTCPCCKGAKIHVIAIRDEENDKASYECKTCNGSGKLV